MATPLRVVARIRPPLPHDGHVGGSHKHKVSVWAVPNESTSDDTLSQIAVSERIPLPEDPTRDGAGAHGKIFTFDRVFGPTASQVEVYNDCARPLVQAVLDGTNACIFAFGCTGAGKTHSMLGPDGGCGVGKGHHGQDGILPRAASELFRRIARLEGETAMLLGGAKGGFSAYRVRASFLEVYRENVFDLLGGPVSASRDAAGSCALREDDTGHVFAENAIEVGATSVEQLLNIVAHGAKARSTAATNVHAHSSRSHALLILTVEHRWRDANCVSIADDAAPVKSQTARLTLVDLAGAESMEVSHGGHVNAAGVATNLGLLMLGRVISALAKNPSKTPGGAHERVPYRDSTLTRIMQSSLSGKAVTQMLACVSPAAHELHLTTHTLGYAQSARNVSLRPTASTIVDEIDPDPMVGDFDDEDTKAHRRTLWIETAQFGDVFARCMGDPRDPLILYVHGSGPQNSSMVWNTCAIDVNRLATEKRAYSSPEAFFHVAIDCPGYGRSPGNKQTIRSYPGEFLSSVITALGRRSVAALVGSSQGACAAFNCALECPDMIHTLAVCHPVGHAPERYTNIAQPCLLIFDTEDVGHPVSVGRMMRRYLQNPRYFEFARSVDGDWECLHMAEELYTMLADNWHNCCKKRAGGRRVTQIPELTRVAGGYRSWDEQRGNEYLPWYGFQKAGQPGHSKHAAGRNAIPREDDNDTASNPDTGEEWRTVLDPRTNTIQYEHVPSGRRAKVRPTGVRVLVARLVAESQSSAAAGTAMHKKPLTTSSMPAWSPPSLFTDTEDEDELGEEEKDMKAAKLAKEKKQREATQENCDLCRKPLLNWVRLARCRCAICACCVERTILYTRQCPACGESVKTVKGVVVSDAGEEEQRRHAEDTDVVSRNDCAHVGRPATRNDMHEQQQYLNELQLARIDMWRVVIEYGNISDMGGAKTDYTTFCKHVVVRRGAGDGCSPQGKTKAPTIARVDFNINPGYSKPTASLNAANDKVLGFAFNYAMARGYPCVMTLHFEDGVVPDVRIDYHVQDVSSVKRRIIIEVPQPTQHTQHTVPGGARRAQKGAVIFDASPPRNGWLRFDAAVQAAHIDYLPEPGDEHGHNLSDHYGDRIPGLMSTKERG
eukprot:GEMP01004288.1.p1 GENE.GEMP01004288.1~~GEMP01004288.1.p1  ORF type:complete len:1118 (+),score=289.91 GEMP01004288.1:86-3439(+)